MNTEIQIFNNLQFGQLRGMNINGEAWLMATDVARRLGYEAYRTKKGENLFDEVLWTDTYLVWTERGKEFISELFNEMEA